MLGIIRLSRTTGFTIVELLIVIVVIGILAGITIVGYNGITSSARDKSLISDAEGVAAEITRYSTKNSGRYGSAVAWYSANGTNPLIKFAPSSGNVIDVSVSLSDYCIRVFNAASANDSITNAYEKGTSTSSCSTIGASIEAGGSWDNSLYNIDNDLFIAPPIAQWKLNGNADDSIGNVDGTISGPTLTIGQNGQANNAYRFDGVNDYIELAPVLSNYTSFSVSVWARVTAGPSAADGYGYIVHQGPAQTQGTSAFWIGGQTTGSATYSADVSGYSSAPNQITSVPSNTTTWRFITMTYDGTNRSTYVDGNLEITYPRSFSNSTAGNRLTLGSAAHTPTFRPALGDIDDVRIYDYVLSAAQIEALHSLGAD